MKSLIVIPARYASKRLPKKPLIKIGDKTLLERVFELAKESIKGLRETDIIVATDNSKIEAHCKEIGAKVLLTDESIKSGSDRVFKVASSLDYTPDIVINLQGDSPFISSTIIPKLINAFKKDLSISVVTPAIKLTWDELEELRKHKKISPFSGTTVIMDKNDNALWFSKNIIPLIREEETLKRKSLFSPVYRHLGLYAYTFKALKEFNSLPQTKYETLEALEQLRFLENNYKIKIIKLLPDEAPQMSGIDSKEDLIKAEKILKV